MPRLRLPPLPPSSQWSNIIPKVSSGQTHGAGIREATKRLYLASQPICDRFVRDLKLRENEVVLSAYSGAGQLTRSLLAGGYNETTASDWEQVTKEQAVVGPRAGQVKRRNQGQFDFPPWDVNEAPKPSRPKTLPDDIVQPKLVIANDPSVVQLSRSLGFDPDLAPPNKWDFADKQTAESLKKFPSPAKGSATEFGVYPSVLEERLVFSPKTVYKWETIDEILSNPLVFQHLPVYDPTKSGSEATKRPWSADPPPLTMVATIPDSVLGDQMIAQWISSAIGSDAYGRSWLWQWGRVRMALLVNKGQYDRIMAKPGETIHCKLSVMAQALFELRPLPPYHHVPDVDKQSTRTETSVDVAFGQGRVRAKGKKGPTTYPAVPPTNFVTQTVVSDFFPWHRLGVGLKPDGRTALERPVLLGIEFVPRLNSPITPEARDTWDYVLRKAFVREAAELKEILPSLAFGAENLLPKMGQEDSPYKGDFVKPDEIIRNLTVPQWERVVDVFDKWAFKPEVLVLDSAIESEERREIGLS